MTSDLLSLRKNGLPFYDAKSSAVTSFAVYKKCLLLNVSACPPFLTDFKK